MKKSTIPSIVVKINKFIAHGNEAIKYGHENESVSWYKKALSLAVRTKNKLKEREVSDLLITLL